MDRVVQQIAAMNGPVAVMAVGAPGSGKTTWMKVMASQLGMIYICPDNVRGWLLGDESDQRVNPQVWQVVHKAIEVSLTVGKSVAVDALHHEPQYRQSEASLYRKFGAKSVVAVNFETSLEFCLERNAARQRKVDETAIRQIYAQLLAQPIMPDEGFDKIFTIKS